MANLLTEFADAIDFRGNPERMLALMRNNGKAFRLIDQNLASPEELTLTSLIDLFNGERRWTYRALQDWLSAAHGIDFASPEADLFYHHQMMDRWLAREREDWIRDVLRGFLEWMHAQRDRMLAAGVRRGRSPLKLQSIAASMRTTAMFLRHCDSSGIAEFTGVSQSDLESFATAHPKCVHALSAFVRYANCQQRRFQVLRLPSSQTRRSTLSLQLSVTTARDAVERWLEPSEGVELRNSLIALLCLFYAQKPRTLLNRKLRDVRVTDDLVEIRFADTFVTIDEPVAARVREWLRIRRLRSAFGALVANEYLFPGGAPTKPFHDRTFAVWLSSQQISFAQLFATSLHSLINAGMEDPSVLTAALGVTKSTAVRYWLEAGADLSSHLYSETIQSFREAGHMDKTSA